MPRTSAQEFVTKVAELFSSSTSSGSVYITSKRVTHPSATSDVQDAQGDTAMSGPSTQASSSQGHPVIFRATNGSSDPSKLVKISTLVAPHEVEAFHDILQPLIRQNLTEHCLRKRDKAKERRVDKEMAQRRKKDEELGGWKGLAKLGSKRGSGRRTRQRAVKRAMKLRKAEREASAKAKAAESGRNEGGAASSQPKESAGSAAEAATTAAKTSGQQPSQGQTSASSGGKKKKKGKK
ncbi:unnamed protein product [Parajaminaea phylloscopi]